MASWIVHLRLAENLLNLIDGLDPAYFATGNIAPDSGIPDENWENFDPPPEILHFKASGDDGWRLADLEFYRQHLHSQKENPLDTEHFSFLLGYFFHLVTDNLWDEQIGKPTSERFAKEFETDPKFIWQVKRDWYGLDFEHVRNKPESIYWRVFLDCEYNQDYLEFLPREAVQQRLAYIKELYQRTDEKIEEWYGDRPDKYLSEQEMDEFIQGTTEKLYRIYNHLWLENVGIPNISSSLGLNIE
jgi:hypothetical protein